MDIRDWILLLVPIFLNGILWFVYHLFIKRMIERKTKRNDIRDEAVLSFITKLQNFNDTLIRVNVSVSGNPSNLHSGLQQIRESVIEIKIFFDTNKFDLRIIEKEYEAWIETWNNLVGGLQKHQNHMLTKEDQEELGELMQRLKTETESFVITLRKAF